MNLDELKERFQNCHGLPADVITSSPGRLEVLGNHTDYNDGLTLSCAVGFRCYAAAAKLNDPVAKLASTAFETPAESFPLELPDTEKGHWARYVLGLVDALRRRGHDVPGFAMLIDSQVPQSAGVSSSAAVEMAALVAIVSLMDAYISTEDMAHMGQESESRAVGAQTGLLDQLTALLGQPDRLIKIDFQSLETQTIPAPSGWCFVAVDSGVKHDLTQEYNARRNACEAAAKAMGVASLRLATLPMLEAGRDKMSAQDYACATHILQENQRVEQAVAYLAENRMDAFGQLLFDSHRSSRLNFKNSCPELDELVAYAMQDDRCVGARLSGGGFGGISIHLVRAEDAEPYRTSLLQAVAPTQASERWSAVCEIGDGAKIHD